jgi:hypothetical protein
MQRLLFTLVTFASLAAAQPSRDNAWRQDLDQLATQLPRLHPNLFYYSPRAVFDAEVAKLRDEIPSLGDADVAIRMAAIVALAHDGHTSLSLTQRAAGLRSLPLQLRWLADGLFVTGATAPYARAGGARVVRIGSLTAEEAHEAVKRLVSHENDAFARLAGAVYLANADVLRALQITPSSDSARLEFQDRSGATFAMEIDAIAPGPTVIGTAYPKRAEGFLPLYLQNGDRNYWFTYIESSRTLYFAYNKCSATPGLPFATFNDQLWATFDAQPVERLIVDLRNNPGGSSSILEPFLRSGLARAGRLSGIRVALITGRATYSSAAMNAIDLHQGPTISYGEATGADTSHYGQVSTLVLANSGLSIDHSTRYYSYPALPPGPLLPDVPVPIYSTDYFARHDPVVAAILADARREDEPGTPAVVNAASFRGPVAPGSIASAFGDWGEGADVLVDGRAAAVFAALPGQVNFRVPTETLPGLSSIRIGGRPGLARVVESAPGLFVAATGQGVVEIYGTGQGTSADPRVYVGKDAAEVIYTGAHPAFPGLWQVNARLPAGAAAGETPVFVTIGGRASNAVTVRIGD